MNKVNNLIFLCFFIVSITYGQSPFVSVWKTDNPGVSSSSEVLFPASGEYSYEWTEMGNPSNTGSGTATDSYTIVFSNPGTYELIITPIGNDPFHRFEFDNEGDKEKILGITAWGDVAWSSFENAFYGAKYLIIPAADAPDLSNVTSMKRAFAMTENFDNPVEHWDMSNIEDITAMFAATSSFNQPLNDWDTSNITQMAETFANAVSFNQPLDNWDVSNVERMSTMFFGAKNFDQPLESWDISNVETVEGMFAETDNFNQPLENWNMSNVEVISGMFYQTKKFNQPIGNWDISNVMYSAGMFDGALAFNQPLNNWNTSNIEVMATMFANNSTFNQPLDNWDVSKVWLSASMFQNSTAFDQNLESWSFNNLEIADSMFNDSGISCENYSLLIHGWANNPDLAENVIFGAAQMKYSPEVIEDRNTLISQFNWTITGDSEGTCSIGLGINDLQSDKIIISPNPAENFVTISGNQELDSIFVFDVNGKLLKEIHEISKTIDVSDLSDGIYLLRLKTSDGKNFTKKLIVRK